MRCSGRYTLREDSEHATSAEMQLDRELRLNEIAHSADSVGCHTHALVFE
jgi:hypothetical protein